ncbi:hypothetical protein ABBQ38_006155 [Trebouxia sp. C0009 RCD-2024]
MKKVTDFMVAARKSPPVQLQPFLTLLHLAEKRQRERRRSRDTRPGSTTPPIPEEPEDVPSDSGYMSGDSLSPPERQQHPAASIHRKHAPPSRSDTRTSTGFREPPVSWHHDGPAIAVGGAQYPVASGSDSIVQEFHDALQRSPDTAVAVAAIKALTSVIRKSTARTMMGLEKELKDAAASLQRQVPTRQSSHSSGKRLIVCVHTRSCNPTAISLKAGCELFLRYTTRTSAIENEDFATAKARIIERGKQFAETSTRARQTIAELGAGFVHHDAVVMVHGFSRVALALLQQVANNGVQFSVVVTEGRPDSTGLAMANALSKMKVPCTVVLDSGVAFALEALKVNLVLVGAEGVVENGGIINKLGSYHIAIAAKEHAIPFYVAAESYKFARLYPLNQLDLPVEKKHVDFGPLMAPGAKIENPSRDYTPPKYISLLFTDLGVLTPAAVSDELIQLYV